MGDDYNGSSDDTKRLAAAGQLGATKGEPIQELNPHATSLFSSAFPAPQPAAQPPATAAQSAPAPAVTTQSQSAVGSLQPS